MAGRRADHGTASWVKALRALWMWCRRNPVVAGAVGLAAAAVVAVAVLSLLYAGEQDRRVREQVNATRTIGGLNESLEKERGELKTSLADSNRRLAMFIFERAERAFQDGQVQHGLLWLVECWRYAAEAGDRAWQHLARNNLSLWRYNCPEVKGVFSPQVRVTRVAFSPDGKTVLAAGENTVCLWDAATAQPVGKPMVHKSYVNSVALQPRQQSRTHREAEMEQYGFGASRLGSQSAKRWSIYSRSMR